MLFSDDDFVNNAYEDVPSHYETTPRIIPQSIRHQTLQTPFQPMIRNQPMNEPIVIPVDNFGDSSNESDPLTPRRSDVSESVSLPKSETSPRSEKSVNSRSQTSDEPGDRMETEIADGSQHGETSRDIPL